MIETHSKLRVNISSPGGRVASVDGVSQCEVPTSDGLIGILPDHTRLMAEVGTGVLRFEKANQVEFYIVSGGLIEVQNNEVTVLADVGESGMSIDVARAKESLERARRRISTGKAGSDDETQVDYRRALLAEKRALARIEAAEAVQQKGR